MSLAPAYSKVFVVANARIPGERAQSIQTVRTAAAFARAGCDVVLLYARRFVRRLPEGADPADPLSYYGIDGAARERLTLEAIPCIDFIERVPRSLQYLPARLEEWTFGRNAFARLRRDPQALVHCREIEVGAMLATARHPRWIFEAHSIPKNPLKERWMRRALRGALGVAAITHGLAADLEAAFGIRKSEILVVPDAFEPDAFASLPAAAEARAKLRIPEGAPLVVYAGHLFTWKGVDTLVAAAKLLPELRFRLVGGLPEDVARVRSLAAGLTNIEILGHRPPGEIPMQLAAADLIVVPNSAKQAISARHTSPLKLFEAMAAGRALIASDLASLREILVDGRNSLLCAPDDAQALAAALKTVAFDSELSLRIATAARADSAKYTFDARADALLAFAREREMARRSRS
ncbi:MAG: glycosyltransferase family 4 protein [Planctomycetes bacterium]|nr:glycosyltransferase family 4 protein [Planctomycetota bacterium]